MGSLQLEPLMIEVAINELATRDQNPNVPYSVMECARDSVECVDAGAQIVHLHARDASSGQQRWVDAAFYADAFRAIREQRDVVLYPTQPGVGLDAFRHVLDLADRSDVTLELATVDIKPIRIRNVIRADGTLGSPYDFGTADPMAEVIVELNRRNVAFHLGVRDVGDMRYLARYREMGLLGDDVVIKIFFDEGLYGPVPDARGILMYLDSVPPGMRCRWFVTLHGGNPAGASIRRLSSLAAAMGGHIRIGLGDNPRLDDNGTYSNADHVRIAVAIAKAAGRSIATMEEARSMLGIS